MSATFSIDRRPLASALARLAKTIPRHSPKAVLTQVRVSVNGAVELSGTDLDSHHREELDAESSGVCDVLVNLVPFRKAVTSSKSKRFVVDVTDGLEGALGSVVVNGAELPQSITVDEMPIAPEDTPIAVANVEPGDLLRCLQDTLPCCDTESSRYALGGVKIEFNQPRGGEASITLVASDGRRLALAECSAHISAKSPDGLYGLNEDDCRSMECVILPAGVALVMCSALKGSRYAYLSIHDDWVELSMGSTRIVARRLEGRFPKWGEVVPESSKFSVCVNLSSMVESCTKCLSVSGDESRGVDLTFRDGFLSLYLSTLEVGKVSEVIRLDNRDAFGTVAGRVADLETCKRLGKKPDLTLYSSIRVGEDLQAYTGRAMLEDIDCGWSDDSPITIYPTCSMTIDVRYLLDALKVVGNGVLQLQFSDGESPVIVSQYQNRKVFTVLMPLTRDCSK